jgi:hypothetical protein
MATKAVWGTYKKEKTQQPKNGNDKPLGKTAKSRMLSASAL